MLENTKLSEWTFDYLYELHINGKILHDIAFNRIKAGAWNESDKKSWIKTVYNAKLFVPIYLVNVESSLAHARIIKDLDSIEYFEKCKKDGYIYVILDGSNRIGCIEEYLKGLFNIIQNRTVYDYNRITIKSKYIAISFLTNCSKKELHSHAITLNSGKAWNSQEKRNALDVFIARYVRNISINSYKTNVGNKLDNIDTKRMEDQELIAHCIHLVQYDNFTNRAGLDNLYNLPESHIKAETYSTVEFHLNTLFSMFALKKGMKFKKSFFLFMFALLYELDKSGDTIKSDKIKNLFDDLADKWELLNSDTTTLYITIKKGKEHFYTWAGLMQFISLEYGQKISILLDYVYSNLKSYLEPIKNSKRIIDTATNSKVRYKLAKLSNCKVRVNGAPEGIWFNPEKAGEEFQEYRLHEIIKSKYIQVDHKHALKGTNKGEDSIDNMELTTAEYNNWKRAKV